jgi:lysophospholipase
MRHEERSLTGGAGAHIVYDVWTPEGEVAGVAVLSHGMGEHARRYDHVVARLGALGLAVYAPDHRGHGRSSGRRLAVRSVQEYVDDLALLVDVVSKDHPVHTPVLIGHSMGALIALAYALDHQERLRALVLSGALVVPGAGVSRPAMATARLLGKVAPTVPLQALDSRYVSRDPEVVARYDADPLVYRGRVPAGLGGAILNTMAGFERRLPSLTLPLLVVHGGADRLVDPVGSRLVAERAGSADLTLKIYDGLFHEVFNEPEQDTVLDDVTGWLRTRV